MGIHHRVIKVTSVSNSIPLVIAWSVYPFGGYF